MTGLMLFWWQAHSSKKPPPPPEGRTVRMGRETTRSTVQTTDAAVGPDGPDDDPSLTQAGAQGTTMSGDTQQPAAASTQQSLTPLAGNPAQRASRQWQPRRHPPNNKQASNRQTTATQRARDAFGHYPPPYDPDTAPWNTDTTAAAAQPASQQQPMWAHPQPAQAAQHHHQATAPSANDRLLALQLYYQALLATSGLDPTAVAAAAMAIMDTRGAGGSHHQAGLYVHPHHQQGATIPIPHQHLWPPHVNQHGYTLHLQAPPLQQPHIHTQTQQPQPPRPSQSPSLQSQAPSQQEPQPPMQDGTDNEPATEASTEAPRRPSATARWKTQTSRQPQQQQPPPQHAVRTHHSPPHTNHSHSHHRTHQLTPTQQLRQPPNANPVGDATKTTTRRLPLFHKPKTIQPMHRWIHSAPQLQQPMQTTRRLRPPTTQQQPRPHRRTPSRSSRRRPQAHNSCHSNNPSSPDKQLRGTHTTPALAAEHKLAMGGTKESSTSRAWPIRRTKLGRRWRGGSTCMKRIRKSSGTEPLNKQNTKQLDTATIRGAHALTNGTHLRGSPQSSTRPTEQG